MHPDRVHAFKWPTIRRRRSDGVVSMKLTVRVRGLEPQYFGVETAMNSSVTSKSGSTRRREPNSGWLNGLISTAFFAAFTSTFFGTDFGMQTSLPFAVVPSEL